MTDTKASRFLRVAYPKLIGYGLLVVAVLCWTWALTISWQACQLMHAWTPKFTCTARFAGSMALHQYGLLLAYGVLSVVTGASLLARRSWAKRLAVAHLLLSIAYVAGDFAWSTWTLMHDKGLLGEQLYEQMKLVTWGAGVVVALFSLALVLLTVLMTRVPWPPRRADANGSA